VDPQNLLLYQGKIVWRPAKKEDFNFDFVHILQKIVLDFFEKENTAIIGFD
jgi:hypothetical protein